MSIGNSKQPPIDNFKQVTQRGRLKPKGSLLEQLWGNKIAIAIIVGMLGLYTGVQLFSSGDNLYGEISLDKKPVLDLLFKRRIACLDTAFKLAVAEKHTGLSGQDLKDADKTEAQKLGRIRSAIASTLRERQLADSGNTAGSLDYFNKFVLVQSDSYASAITGGKWANGPVKITATLADSCKLCATYPATVSVPLALVQNKRKKPIEFFTDHPLFGFWMVFSIAQIVLWFMTVPLLIGNVRALNDKLLNDQYKVGFWRIVGNTILPGIFVGIFCYLFYGVLLQKRVITNDYFLADFSDRSQFYSIIGYGVAAICFGVYLALARKIDQINADVVANNIPKDDPDLNAAYAAFKAAFNNSFLFSALILSFCVLWSGILVNALNDTEAFRYYHLLSGKYFIPSDFVYLVGLMHTLILLIFYIPVKLKFDNLAIVQTLPTDSTADGVTPSPVKSIFSILTENIGPLLVTASPLLASLVHSFLSMVTQ